MSGSGTVDDPYVISGSGIDVSDAIQFADTDTVDFTVNGSGTDTDPWTVRADATVAFEDLSDFNCAAPSANDVIQFDGTSWVCGPPATVPVGEIITEAPITGDGTTATPIGLDLVTDGTLAGSGTVADPLRWEIVYAAGTQQVTGAQPGDPASAAVTFPAGRFADTPFITLGIYTSVPGERFASHIDKTPNGFTMMLGYTGLSSSINAWISWHAFVRPGEGDDPTVFAEYRRLNPLRQIITPHDEVGAAPEDAIATCHVIGCYNQDIGIPVHTHWTDEDGAEHDIGSYQCGVCSQPITDVQPIS